MIKSLYLRDFRNYKEERFSFDPKVNVIWGDNAQGKSNLLEALYLFITGRSFRTPHLAELIRFGASAFYATIIFEHNGIEQELKFTYDGLIRKIFHNVTPLPALSALLGMLQGVILAPEDRVLIKGGPILRRQFLDLLISQAKPLYLQQLTRYSRAMKQRNTLLKQRAFETIEIWEEEMALAASFLTIVRQKTIEELQRLCHAEALSKDKLTLIYRFQAQAVDEADLTAYFKRQYLKYRERESDLGITLTGPHRDDFTLLINEKEARKFASEGQLRSAAAALKIAQWKWLENLSGKPPILYIDDLGVSFDMSREALLYERVGRLGQVFVTSARSSPSSYHSIHIHTALYCL